MISSWHGNSFRNTGSLPWGQITGHRWITLMKGQYFVHLKFWLNLTWTSYWKKVYFPGDLRRYDTNATSLRWIVRGCTILLGKQYNPPINVAISFRKSLVIFNSLYAFWIISRRPIVWISDLFRTDFISWRRIALKCFGVWNLINSFSLVIRWLFSKNWIAGDIA